MNLKFGRRNRSCYTVLLPFVCAARKIQKTDVNSTIFELQQSFLHIFGVAQNF